MAVAAQNQPAQPVCYSTCPPTVDLRETWHVLHVGSENIEDFSVRVRPGVIGGGPAPTGTVTVKSESTVLCTITLTPTSMGSGSCSPSANALPAGHHVVIAYYGGDSMYSPAQSHPRQLQVLGIPGRG